MIGSLAQTCHSRKEKMERMASEVLPQKLFAPDKLPGLPLVATQSQAAFVFLGWL